jgi:RNA polymerase sigma-70 factor (ECF subfamily)
VAVERLESSYLSAIPRHVARLGLDSTQLDELTQLLRIKLLSAPNPRIASYAGRAPLDAWLRVATVRAALDLLAEEKSHAANAHNQPSIAFLMMAEADPELLASKNDVREAFQSALEASLANLGARDQILLRMQVIDGLGLDALARVFRVHRATVARWLVAARTTVFDGVRERLGLRRRPTSSEFRSLVRLVKDDLQISVDRVFPARD